MEVQKHSVTQAKLGRTRNSIKHTSKGLKVCNYHLKQQQPSLSRILRTPKQVSTNFLKNLYCRKYQPFNIKNIEPTKQLRRNKKYMEFFQRIFLYNKKLQENSEQFVVNYKLNEFIYTSLQLCHAKTPDETNLFLGQVEKWLSSNQDKRQFFSFHTKSHKKQPFFDGDIIRTHFKSDLPLEIDEYKRKKFLPSPSTKANNILNTYLGRRSKNKTTSGMYEFNEQDDDLEKQEENYYIKNLNQDDRISEKENNGGGGNQCGSANKCDKRKNVQLPNLKCYRTQILKLKKSMQQKQDEKIMKEMFKHQARLHTKTAANFFKGPPNTKDKYFKKFKAPLTRQSRTMFGARKDSCNESLLDSQNNSQILQEVQPNNLFTQTIEGFYDIKKQRLESLVGNQKMLTHINEKKDSNDENKEDQKNSEEMDNIDGVTLIKNIYEVTKPKKNKKKKK